MRNLFKFIAIMGLISIPFGNENPVSIVITWICLILWIFYPGDKEND